MIIIKCRQCDGYYIIRAGKYNVFAGCSHYPVCRSTIRLDELVLEYIKIYGIGIYRWKRECWRCNKETPVHSYYLTYELGELPGAEMIMVREVGLGDIKVIDDIISQNYSTVKLMYSHTTQSKYMANTCVHCGALQGRNHVVDDPHGIITELWHNRDMEKFLVGKIHIDENLIKKFISQHYYIPFENEDEET